MIRLEDLRLRNFRCFEECRIEFGPELTVLVARNGQGKTAILDGIALALGLFVDSLAGTRQWRGFISRDIRRLRDAERTMTPAAYVEFEAMADVDGRHISWRRWMKGDSDRARTSTKEARPLTGVAEQLHERLAAVEGDHADDFSLPLVSYYGTGRQWNQDGTKPKRPLAALKNQRFSGYVDCLTSSSNFGLFADWYQAMFDATAEAPVSGFQEAHRPERVLAAVNRAVDSVLESETGWKGLHWDAAEKQLFLDHAVQGRLPLSFLSDGVRNTVALVADIAHRCARLNPHLGENAADMTRGILLIDEVDLHLHPEWQQSIIRTLRAAFPCLQLVVSTHSPQVLSTVDVSAIRVVRVTNGRAQIGAPQFQTRGVESADVLAAIMGVDPVPKVPEAKLLSDYRALIEEGRQDSEAATALREQLLAHFGQQHPLMLECDRLIRFSQFKRRRLAKGGNDAQT